MNKIIVQLTNLMLKLRQDKSATEINQIVIDAVACHPPNASILDQTSLLFDMLYAIVGTKELELKSVLTDQFCLGYFSIVAPQQPVSIGTLLYNQFHEHQERVGILFDTVQATKNLQDCFKRASNIFGLENTTPNPKKQKISQEGNIQPQVQMTQQDLLDSITIKPTKPSTSKLISRGQTIPVSKMIQDSLEMTSIEPTPIIKKFTNRGKTLPCEKPTRRYNKKKKEETINQANEPFTTCSASFAPQGINVVEGLEECIANVVTSSDPILATTSSDPIANVATSSDSIVVESCVQSRVPSSITIEKIQSEQSNEEGQIGQENIFQELPQSTSSPQQLQITDAPLDQYLLNFSDLDCLLD